MLWAVRARQRQVRLAATNDTDIAEIRIIIIPPRYVVAFQLQPTTRNSLASLLAAVGSFSEKHHDTGVNPVSQTAKGADAFVSGFRESRRILEWPMKPFRGSRKHGAILPRSIADRNDEIELPTFKFPDRLRPLRRDVNTYLMHDINGFSSYGSRMRTSRKDLVKIAAFLPQQSFDHLAARRIPGAENEHSFLIHGYFPIEREGRRPAAHFRGATAQANEKERWPRRRLQAEQ